ncbi:hypothetical protein ACIQOW_21630 [Kitasatospora sp. NPDC091335]|uniref:hypothetical protein n=1 Tax=Kitasatospora sp. NPDC091335 TaxID=3364085 RepID=UPI0038041E4C
MPLGVDLDRLRTDLGATPAQMFESLCVHLFPAILDHDFGPVLDGTLLALRPPDGGLEACARTADGRVVGIQVKHHAALKSALRSMDESVGSALAHHPDLTDMLVFLPQDFTAGGTGTPGTRQWSTASSRWAAMVRRVRPGHPVVFHPYTKSLIERAVVSFAEEAVPAYFDARYLRLSDLHRHAAAAARTVRRRPWPAGPQPPQLTTFLSEALAGLDDPSPLVSRLTETASGLRLWAGWRPAADGLPVPSVVPVSAASERWTASSGRRAECADGLDGIARLLGEEDRTDPGILRRRISQALRLCGRVAVEVREVHDELLDAVRASQPYEALPGPGRGALGRLLAVLKDLLACARTLYTTCADPALATRQTGTLLVGGGWGTGKSYGLGGWVRGRIAVGAPTAFVCGHEFGPDEPFEAQLPRLVAPGTRAHGLRDLLAALQQQALLTGRRAVLAVDALNEVRCLRGDFRVAFESLAEVVGRYPLVTLVGTVRMDARPAVPEQVAHTVSTRGHGFLWNPGVASPDRSWRIYQDMYGLPELLLPPDVSELRRPLMLAVLAWCLHRTPRPPGEAIVPPTVGDLFQTWLAILNDDHAAYLDRVHDLRSAPSAAPPPLVTLACRALADAMGVRGSLDYGTAGRVLSGVPGAARPAVVLRWLESAGVLALDPDTRRVRFAVQRFAEHVRAVNLLNHRRRSAAVTRLVKEFERLRAAEPESARLTDRRRMLEALAGAAPHAARAAELADLVPRRYRSAVSGMVLESLEGRAAPRVSRSSRALLARWLRTPDTAQAALLAVLVNATCPRHPLGVGFLDAQLSAWSRGRYARWFADPVLEILDDEDLVLLLRRLVKAAGAAGARGDEAVAEAGILLLWLSGVGHHGLRDACVRTLADLWTDRPAAIARLLDRFGGHRDELVTEAYWLAAYGALARSTELPSAPLFRGAVDRALTRPHLRIHDAVLAVRGLLGPEPGAAGTFPAVPLRRPRLLAPFCGGLIAEEAVSLSWCPFEETDPRPRQAWLARRAQLLALGAPRHPVRVRGGSAFDAADVSVAKALQRAQQEWYAEQATLVRDSRPVPVPGEHGAARYHQRTIDPTLGARWPTRLNTSSRPGNWWTPPFTAAGLRGSPTGPPTSLTSVLTKPDPSGTPWLLMNALHHLLDEGDEGDEQDERPVPGLPLLHDPRSGILRLSDTWRAASPAHRTQRLPPVLRVESFVVPRSDLASAFPAPAALQRLRPALRWPGQAYLSEYYGRPEFAHAPGKPSGPEPTAVTSQDIGVPPPAVGRFFGARDRPVPTRRLTDRLDVRWTGRQLDFADRSSGELVLTDPGFAGEGPESILLRQTAVDRLLGQDDVLLWAVTLVEPVAAWSVGWSAYCVLDSGTLCHLPGVGPSTGHRLPPVLWPRPGVPAWRPDPGG